MRTRESYYLASIYFSHFPVTLRTFPDSILNENECCVDSIREQGSLHERHTVTSDKI